MLEHSKLALYLEKKKKVQNQITSIYIIFFEILSFAFKNWYYIIHYFKWENRSETTFNFYQSKSFPS